MSNHQQSKTNHEIILPDGGKMQVKDGTMVSSLAPSTTENGYPVIAYLYNNKVTSLERMVDRDGTIGLIDITSRDGGMIYRRSLTFLLLKAVSDLYPGLRVYINHSLNKGYYGEVYSSILGEDTPQPLVKSDIERIKVRMKELVDENIPFIRTEGTVAEAMEMFKKAGLLDKVELLKYRSDDEVSIYHCGNLVNHFYGQLLPSTGHLTQFDIKLCGEGFVLVFPSYSKPDELPEYKHEEGVFKVFQEYEQWMKILGVRTVAHLNSLVDKKKINEYIMISEALQEKKLAYLADKITTHLRQPRIILLSGPSSSGKTTTVKRLAIQLRVNGFRPLTIGLDDFFVSRDKTPIDESGEFDFEAFQAIDVESLQQVVKDLLAGKEVQLPRYDFIKGRSFPGEVVRLEKGQHLILEGIHALNPGLLPTIPDGAKYKIYISPLTHLNIDDHNRIPSSDARLIRRMVRDSQYRGYDAASTLARWPSVRRGEEKNIFPYQGKADFIFNSSLPYEVSVLKPHAMKVLVDVPADCPVYSEAARLKKFLSYFREISDDCVPAHSLLREFIGGSFFAY